MKKGDIVIIVLLVITNIASIFFMKLSNTYAYEKYAVIKVGGEKVKTISFNDKTKGVYDFNFENEVGYIEVKDGRVRMLEMDKKICPKKVCSLTGWIDKKYEAIICLPNKIAVDIENKDVGHEKIDEISF
jgi:hypothetical protein